MPYFPQSHPAFNGLRHLLLMYGHAGRPWTGAQLTYSIAHLDAAGQPDDWLFDSLLFLNARAGSGRDYCADVNLGTTMCGEGDFFAACSPRPAQRDDWEELVDFYLGDDGAVPTLDRTIAQVQARMGRPYGTRRNVVLMLPYPHITQPDWGRLAPNGPSLDFSTRSQHLARASEQRLAASAWMVDEIARRFAGRSFEHVHLLGVYWMFETVYRSWDVDDHWLLKELRRHVHRQGLKFLWIPFWSTYNVHLLDDYRRYYFDLAFLQPNYMFYREGRSLEAAAAAARARHAGLEMEYYLELDEPIGVSGERRARFREYLNGGVTWGYMRQAACAHFQGVGALERMHAHEDPVERELYDDIYHFVKGDYRVKPALSQPTASVAPPRVALAVDLGGTNLRAALVDERGGMPVRRAVATPSGGETILGALVDLVETVRRDGAGRGLSPVGIGVSTGGRVDPALGMVLGSTSLLEGWAGVPLRARLEARFGVPVRVDNDGHCAALAERRFGHGRDVDHFVSIVVGSGVGGGVVVDGALVRGASNAAGEVGHVAIDPDGPGCTCGSRGCVEAFASGTGLAARARERMSAGALDLPGVAPEALTAERLAQAAAEGHAGARAMIEEGGAALGVAVASLVNVFNPERVVLSGSVLRAGEPYLAAVRREVEARAIDVARDRVEIVVSDLEETALLGAAALVFEV